VIKLCLNADTHKNHKTRHPHDVGNPDPGLSSQITINITEIMFMICKSEASSLVTTDVSLYQFIMVIIYSFVCYLNKRIRYPIVNTEPHSKNII
jgi:hypothetical protein